MTVRTLEAWCFGTLAGLVTDDGKRMDFEYSRGWLAAGHPPISQSLPTDGAFTPEAVAAFFGGLLPEGGPRAQIARRLGISEADDFGLLEALAGDTAGAVSVVVPGNSPSERGATDDVTWLTDAQVAEQIEQLPSRPMHADEDGEFRLSLAGAQDKLPVVIDEGGRIGLTRGHAPSTHIMKIPIAGFDDTVANEAMSLDIGRRLGVTVVDAQPRRIAGKECLLITRYDRESESGAPTTRLHQEDFCQALGIAADRKYENAGGPTLKSSFELVRSATSVPAQDAVALLDYVVLSFLIGNCDAHGKNYSLLYRPDRAELASAYDVLSTWAYKGLSRKLAMKIGTEPRPDYVRARHWEQMLAESGLGVVAAKRRIFATAAAAPACAADARVALADTGWGCDVLDRIVTVVEQRAGSLVAELGS